MTYTLNLLKNINQTGDSLYLCKGTQQGRPVWYYVKVDKLKLPLFLAEYRTQGGMIDLARFGTVLHSGWGAEPPYAVTRTVEALS